MDARDELNFAVLYATDGRRCPRCGSAEVLAEDTAICARCWYVDEGGES